MLIRYFTRRKEEDEETGEEEKVQRKGKLRIASIILAIQVLVAIFANFRRDDDEEEEAEAAA